MHSPAAEWPALPLEEWEPTYQSLHMAAQIAGKIVLATSALSNHWWNVALKVDATGLTSGLLEANGHALQVRLDLHDHVFCIERGDGPSRRLSLRRPVRELYREVVAALRELDVAVPIRPMPVEVADPIAFDRDDRHVTYVPEHARRFWEVLRRIEPVFARFRARFTGKASPVHFFWGSCDLAVTRFSGRTAPSPPNADRITRLGYNAELSSLGFWPGGSWIGGIRVEEPIFYSYVYPASPEYGRAPVRPAAARFDERLGEFVLPYEAVRRDRDPARAILEFAQSTYEAGARLQGWPTETLELSA
jgi:hypothetical protein